MTKRIFLDVGGHMGQTLREVIKDYYNFDEVHCFEPALKNYRYLRKNLSRPNVFIHNIGLSNKTENVYLYDPGKMGASIYEDKGGIDSSKKTLIKVVEVSKWIKDNLDMNDTIIMKLNCEGAECDIIENMINNNVYNNIDNIMIDFDVRKVPSQKDREEYIKDLIKNKKNYCLCEDVMIGKTHGLRIKNWLDSIL